MSGVALSEVLLLFVIGLLILGPERLPRVASQIGRWVGRARRTANQLRYQLEREIALADIEKKATEKKKRTAEAGPEPAESRSETSHADAGEPAAATAEEPVDETKSA